MARALYLDGGPGDATARCSANRRWGDRDLGQALLEHLQLQPGQTVVDVGCGTGEHLRLFAACVAPGGRALGLDFSAAAVRVVRQEGVEALVADGARLPLRDSCANALTCNFALYYLPDLLAALQDWWRVLRPNGRLVLSGPAAASNQELYRFHEEATGCAPSDADRLALGYVAGPVAAALPAAGFEVVHVQSFTNRVTFPDAASFLDYWIATSLFRRTPLARIEQGRLRLAGHSGPLVITKEVTILEARRSSATRPRGTAITQRKSAVDADVVVLGAGLAGLAAAAALGERAVVLERDERPGGLVKTECHGGYWFDRVIHLLYFADAATAARVRALLGDVLAPCEPVAWVETAAGVAQFPLQSHLADLEPAAAQRCLADLEAARSAAADLPAPDFEAWLRRTFGETLCRLFFLPYNRKMWRRPLNELAASGFLWNLAQPTLDALRPAVAPTAASPAANPPPPTRAYNANGWYPRPAPGAPWRGMELLARALAQHVPRLELAHAVTGIDLENRVVLARCGDVERAFRFRHACLSTLPLPATIRLCDRAPADLRDRCLQLRHNRVISVGLGIRGPRPQGRGHWRYYPEESIVFTRLVHLHEFDPHNAPEDGWPLLVEIPAPAESPPAPRAQLLARVRRDLDRVGALPAGSRIVVEQVWDVDPAYVVFGRDDGAIAEQARTFLRAHGVEPMGRYGRWEYSSMAQVLRDGLAWAESLAPAGGDT